MPSITIREPSNPIARWFRTTPMLGRWFYGEIGEWQPLPTYREVDGQSEPFKWRRLADGSLEYRVMTADEMQDATAVDSW